MNPIKTFDDLSEKLRKEKDEEHQRERLERIKRIGSIQDRKVVAGVFRPKPANREAAMLLSSAPWQFHPPIESRKEKENNMTSINKPHGAILERVDLPMKCGDQIVKSTKINGEEGFYIKDIADAFVKHLEKTLEPDIMNIAIKAMSCRETLDASIKDIGSTIELFDATAKAAVNEVRMKRMSIVSECANMVGAMRDVRQFFLGPDYEKEQKRLSEFVDLCERLQRLKESGFLDTVADTMIRLSCNDRA